MAFVSYLIKRLGFMGITLFLITVITFVLTNILPGNVALMILGPNATEESIAQLEAQMGLDQPLYLQYFDWVFGLIQGDMGTSLRYNSPVVDEIGLRLPRSLLLAISATIVSVSLSIPLGVIAAVKKNSPTDLTASMIAFVGLSLPIFLWGIVFIYVFALNLGAFPTRGYVSPLEDPLAAAHHLILPASAMGIALTAYIMRMTRSSMIDELSEDYIAFARAKGLEQRAVVVRHALLNASIPIVTVIAFQFSTAFGGVVVLEEVFSWPGIGQLTLTAIENRDIPLLQGCIIVIAMIFMVSNFLADMFYAYVDPRIRYGGEE
ncbi:ABC transporter permease [Natrarchaeobaculum sulfurireducens]|uniref:ABC-type dipeptide/oligopeptide/nickel transport system, permease component n=1 Tax=Natrarchaeobaculum sulfurireducens TaxID=2044521 RepID=A0A346PK97_9EURY|nr:ABC transporter permease [Natrarchaeobaculum sulfurireducens]AXR79942.1 ABC-type dipeptide/oligopeptide/nickel transport system, permease component [Natrarchaeobaculum sulfurireducens]